MALLNQTIGDMGGDEIPGDVVFQLYDTFGFPTDLTADVARERGLTVDMDGFDKAMKAQQERSKASARFSANVAQRIYTEGKVEFSGYERTEEQSTVVGVFGAEGQAADALAAGESGIVVLDRTPFYAESGGQVGDTGVLQGEGLEFQVTDTRPGGDQHLHVGTVTEGRVTVGHKVAARIDAQRRHAIVLNHSATHLMHAALRDELGNHVQQKGSLVAPDRLRFDFSHPEPVTRDQLRSVEAAVNAQIQGNTEVLAEVVGYDDAINRGAMALFGEKYGDQVRVLTMGGGYSVELCGGTHVGRTGDIGVFRMVSESGVAAGVRRIEAVTGRRALDWIDQGEEKLLAVEALVKSGRGDVDEKVAALLEENRRLARALEQATEKLASAAGSDVAERAVDVNGVKVIAAQLDGDPKSMLQTLDTLKSKLGSCVVVLGNVAGGKANLIVGVSKDLTDRITAPDILKVVGTKAGARGGGRPDMARAGGGDPDALPGALGGVADLIAERLA
jgi:alanyl-tRNA synthetase